MTSRPTSPRKQLTARADMPDGLRQLLQHLPQAVFLCELLPPHLCRWGNDAAQAMFGGALQGAEILAPQSTLLAAVTQAAQGHAAVTLSEHTFLGEECPHLSVFVSGGYIALSVVRAGALRDDIGAEARAALRPAALMARMLAHEIKNPLAGIQAAGQLLGKSASDAGQTELCKLIVRESDRIRRLVDRVMVFDDDAPQRLTPVNIHAPLEQALSAVTTGSTIKILRSFDPSLPDVMADHDQLVQIFTNLCLNALEAGATELHLRTSYAATNPPVDARRQTKLPVTVSIGDNGQGMDVETSRRLFEAYYTTKEQGHGLGLAIVAKIIDDHGGMVTVTTDSNTVFTLSFPHAKAGVP